MAYVDVGGGGDGSGGAGPQGPQGPKGDRGDPGPIGPQGPIGNTGPAGAQGPIGPTGLTGPKGADGANGMNGATGATGAQGPAGVKGDKGDTGNTGATGAVGATGPQGAVGPQGPAGADSTVPGPTGATGATGPQGPQGNTGATGPQGNTGTAGTNGIDGTQIYYGAGAPANTLGSNKDFYITSDSTTLYGPKTAGTWGNSVSLIGPQGPTGPAGPTGPTGAAGAATFPLAAPTGTTASPNLPYGFSGVTTAGHWYNTTTSALIAKSGGIDAQQTVGASSGFGGWTPVGSDTEIPVQINAASQKAGQYAIYNQGALAMFYGYNNYTGGGVNFPLGGWIRSYKVGDNINCTVTPVTTNSVVFPWHASGASATPGFLTVGSSTDSKSQLGVNGGVGIGNGVFATTAAPTNGLLVQGASTFQGAVTFQANATGLTFPTGTTASPIIGVPFTGALTSGLAYNTTANVTQLWNQNSASQSAFGASTGFGNWLPTASDAEQVVQQNAQANVASWHSYFNQGALAFMVGYNNFNGGANFPLGPWLRAYKVADPIWFTVTPQTTGTIAYGIKIASSTTSPGYVSINGSTNSMSSLGVSGGTAIGSGVYASTPAPTNGLLVQGATTVQSTVTSTTASGTPSFVSSQGFKQVIDAGTFWATGSNMPTSYAPMNKTIYSATASQIRAVFVAPFAGSVVGISGYANGATGGASVSFQLFTSTDNTTYTASGFTATMTSSVQQATATAPKGLYTFAAGTYVMIQIIGSTANVNQSFSASLITEMGA